jgi:hypothetical protein
MVFVKGASWSEIGWSRSAPASKASDIGSAIPNPRPLIVTKPIVL